MWALIVLFVGFLIGALTAIAVGVLGIAFVIKRLSRKVKQEEQKAASPSASSLDLSSHIKKQGVVWVLNPEKVPKPKSVDKVPKEHKKKKEILEVTPVRIFAKIKDSSLILAHADGTLREIQLKGCNVSAVSATAMSSRKWAKRYPIKVENDTSVLYEGSKTIYIYLETSWEKESWCKALRIASYSDKEKLKWLLELNQEFQSYLSTLNTGYPLFMKPAVGSDNEHMDKSTKLDGSSKVRHYLKKLSRKVSKNGTDNKMSGALTSGCEERKMGEKWHSLQESLLGSGVPKTAPIGKALSSSIEGKIVPPSTMASASGSGSHCALLSDAEYDDKIGGDEGTLCWNLLISRLFFDVKRNTVIKSSIQSRIQRTLSNMRIPSYIGEITCTDIDLGSLPPYLSYLRVLPSDMKEVWALEIEFQYSGGLALDVETRLDICESDLKEGKVDKITESSSIEEVPPDILEDFEYLGKQLELSKSTNDAPEHEETDLEPGGMGTYEGNRRASPTSRWKSVINLVAKQVSQVPLSLAIKVSSLKGTLRLHIKPPPSDQLWFGFTSMPEIDFDLESYVGEHKISSGRIAVFLINRFKATIQETLVLPNCESVCVPWMLAEKDDWVPCKVAPFMWRANNHQEAVETPKVSASSTMDAIVASQVATRDTVSQGTKHVKRKKVEELKTPLLISNDDERESLVSHDDSGREDETERALELRSSPSRSSTDGTEDGHLKKMGTRARMQGLRKKMGEKLEEKKRVIEEKSRHMVERMKGPEKEK